MPECHTILACYALIRAWMGDDLVLRLGAESVRSSMGIWQSEGRTAQEDVKLRLQPAAEGQQ